MSEFKGTKGEWGIYNDEAIHIVDDSRDFAIAKIFTNSYIKLQQAEANAKLISCAPLMLETLKECIDLLNRVQAPRTPAIMLTDRIEQLIKKATTL